MNFNLEYITNYIDKKINEDEWRITVTFYELVMREKLTKDQVDIFLTYSKTRLINMGYTIYITGDTYKYNNETYTIESNIFYVAIKTN